MYSLYKHMYVCMYVYTCLIWSTKCHIRCTELPFSTYVHKYTPAVPIITLYIHNITYVVVHFVEYVHTYVHVCVCFTWDSMYCHLWDV